jgi:Domain of Unknown Function (DUF1080)
MNRIVLLASVALLVCPLARAADNELTDQEKADGWILMFDGKTTAGWMCGNKPMPAKQAQDGALNVLDQGVYCSHYDRKFSDFHFSCDYKFDKGTNSGLFFRIAKPGDNGIGRGFEIQVLDSYGKPPTRFECGSLYEFLAPTKQTVKPAGEWNHCEVICKGPIVKVILNGEEVINADMDQWTQAGKNPDGSKNKFKWALKDMPREGYIGLSFHDKGKNCWYKNIKVKPLNGVAK